MNLTTRMVMCIVAFFLLAGIGGYVVAGSGKAALTTADPSCGDPTSSDIYIDCGNGTVTDNRTGLTWLKNVGCLTMGPGAGVPAGPSAAKLTWDRATIEAHNLSDGVCDLTDGSKPGDWRMPTIDEWMTMVADGVALACNDPALTNAKGNLCHSADPIFANFCGFGDNGDYYWSATSDTGATNTHAFVVDLYDGITSVTRDKTFSECLWPVRLSQGPGG
jgi:hypothetical protein